MSNGFYTTAQICENGHISTSRYEKENEGTFYCETCGARTITECPNCGTNIRGYFYDYDFTICSPYSAPSFCFNCGNPFPWTQSAIDSARELALESDDLTEEDAEAIATSMLDITSDNPRTELASIRIKKFVKRAGANVGGAIERIAISIGTEAAIRLIKGM